MSDPGAKNDKTQQRGTCPECGRMFQVKQDGTVFHHGGPVGGGWNSRSRSYRCKGAGQRALSVLAGGGEGV